ncbi:G-coupled receptor -like protein, partial [Brachionus plicatilis]
KLIDGFLYLRKLTLISQPKPSDPKLIRVIDFGTGDYSNDYTGHGFLPVYIYDRQRYLLNNTYEYAGSWKISHQNQKFQFSNDKNRLPISPTLNNIENNQFPNEKFTDNSIPKVTNLEEYSPYVLTNQNKIPIYDWDPLTDSHRKNLKNVPDRNLPYNFNQWYIETISDNSYQEVKQSAAENPLNYKDISYIDSYRYAKVWWKNESFFSENRQEYVFRIKPEESFHRFNGVKQEEAATWTSPYFWCVDPSHWMVAVKAPIWADNDFQYKNKHFYSNDVHRFIGLTELVLNYEETDIDQCPEDRLLNAFASTSLCDTTSNCLALPYFGLKPGGYECECMSGFVYPFNIQGPYKGLELPNRPNTSPLCDKSEGLLQYPNWISHLFDRRCGSLSFQDIVFLNDDDERFTVNLRNHANQVFKPQMSQALRIAHILSSYLQLHSPFSTSSVNSQTDYGHLKNVEGLKPDPQLDESIIVGEIMSTLISNYPIQEVNVFFNGSEFEIQKFFSIQNTLSFGLSAIRSDIELILNRSNDDSHIKKTWYMDSIKRFRFSGKTKFGGPYSTQEEKQYFESAGPFDNGLFGETFKLDRFGIEMNIRKTFDGLNGNVEISPKYYDAASAGVWFGPYFDCQKRYMKTKTTLRMLFSVPIITTMKKEPVGFVSVVVGSDLKWWRINPCETSKQRNMFQNIHKCDQETTICQEQNVPELESGFYLSSYKCICKANYEFPFIDYGSSYFEGATMEREFDKKMKGMPNIFERLKCRPKMDQIYFRDGYILSHSFITTSNFSLIHIIFLFQYFLNILYK